ncbi:ATP-dependent translocase ABCB1-like [Physella acuta]|uniref:ATP-dependent translocase ABCB1-like n=1 Tax=Physella acuta TaxID=109671 RepID=UPI0027DC671C|nr:ATP-dependent translocase ABCB1-like [Physella acuta]
MDEKPTIDSNSDKGTQPSSFEGTIQFIDIDFSYPSRSDVKVLSSLNLHIAKGQTVAIVGASGSGKSTIVQLLLRFYTALRGQILIDGHDIESLNLRWLRQHIGLVSQEPVLFATTIAENIRYGRKDASMEDIIQASKMANAYDFIMKLPNQFETYVGEHGAQLSGGQKQRIAIARALVKDPKILLLDEATSALDTESEAIVQDALDKARQGRTTLIIAHRLSTIQNADMIVTISKGHVEEMGTHDELLARGGAYSDLVHSQRVDSTPETSQSPKKNSMLRILKMSLKDWPYFCAGSTGSFISGAVVPSFGFVFGDVVKFLSSSDERVQEEMINKYSLITFGIGCVYTLATFVTKISWFDEPRNSVGVLTTKLASEATHVQEVLTNSIAMMIQCASAVVLSLCFSAFYSYPMTLMFLAIYPVIMFIGRTHVWLSKKFHTETSKALESATAKLALQSMVNIREVAALTMEEEFHKKYVQTLERSPHGLHRYLVLTSICFGIYRFIPYFVYCLGYALGGYLIEEGTLEFADFTRVFECLLVGSLILSRIMMDAGDLSAAGAASNIIFAQVDEAPSDEEAAGGSVTLDKEKFSGSVKFSGVHFRYPMRSSTPVLNGLDLKVKSGETLALVGESGCGKSTTIQLLEKFYAIESGAVFLDNHNIEELSTKWLRMQIGLVSQEPVLFDRSLAENIAYGDNTREVGMEEIIEAARTANIHTFIQSLPSGYETKVGNKGTQLSGGQKQRVAIARALIRNPKILLLDEATSALDAESEKVVLEALDKARQGRTCITIAHRLSTIKNVDMIAVLKRGVVAETGTHRQLKSQRGEYYNMLTAQAGNITS